MEEKIIDNRTLHQGIPVILILGYGKVGKDTTSDYLVSKYGYKKKASGDKMRELQSKINPIVEHRYKFTDTDDIEYEHVVYKRYNEWLNIYGYEAAKDPKNVSGFRQSLVDLAESIKSTFNDEIWIDSILPLNGTEKGIVISDGRNQYEIKRALHYGCIVIKLNRNGIGPANKTEEESIRNCESYITEQIDNNGTKEELYKKIDDIMYRYSDAKSGKYRG